MPNLSEIMAAKRQKKKQKKQERQDRKMEHKQQEVQRRNSKLDNIIATGNFSSLLNNDLRTRLMQKQAREAVAAEALNGFYRLSPSQVQEIADEMWAAYDCLKYRKGNMVKAVIVLEDWITTMQVCCGFLKSTQEMKDFDFALLEKCPAATKALTETFFTPADDVEARKQQLNVVEDVIVFAEHFLGNLFSRNFINLCNDYARGVLGVSYYNSLMNNTSDSELDTLFHYMKHQDLQWCKNRLGLQNNENGDYIVSSKLIQFATFLPFVLWRSDDHKKFPVIFSMDDFRQPEIAQITSLHLSNVAIDLLSKKVSVFEDTYNLSICDFELLINNLNKVLKKVKSGTWEH